MICLVSKCIFKGPDKIQNEIRKKKFLSLHVLPYLILDLVFVFPESRNPMRKATGRLFQCCCTFLPGFPSPSNGLFCSFSLSSFSLSLSLSDSFLFFFSLSLLENISLFLVTLKRKEGR